MMGASGADGDRLRGAGGPRPRAPVYAIADVEALGRAGIGLRAVPGAVSAMAAGGAGWIQLRAKRLEDRAFYELARACREELDGTGADLWIDDRTDIACLAEATGVHLGQSDLPPSDARRIAGPTLRIGYSTHDRDQVAAAARDPAVDVIAIGPVFATATKENPDPVTGLGLVRRARAATDKPLVAIGGIDEDTIGAVLEAGADAAAVISAVCCDDPEAAVRRLTTAAARSGG